MVQSHHQSNEYLEILFNKKKLEALPADLKAIVRYAIMAESADMSWKFQDWNSRDLEELKTKHKVKVVKTPKPCSTPSSRPGMPCCGEVERQSVLHQSDGVAEGLGEAGGRVAARDHGRSVSGLRALL